MDLLPWARGEVGMGCNLESSIQAELSPLAPSAVYNSARHMMLLLGEVKPPAG